MNLAQQQGMVLILVLITQAIMALLAIQSSQEAHLQTKVTAAHWQQHAEFYHAQQALDQLSQMAGLIEDHRPLDLGIAPNDCSLNQWFAGPLAERAPWVSLPSPKTVSLFGLVIDWADSGCVATDQNMPGYSVVIKRSPPRQPSTYIHQMVSGTPLVAVYWALYP